MREAIIRGTPDREDDGKRRRDAAPEAAPSERPVDPDEKLRPQRLDEIVGQRSVAERLAISLEAAQEAGRAAAAHPLRRPARAGQDDLRHGPAQRAGRRAEHDQRRRRSTRRWTSCPT